MRTASLCENGEHGYDTSIFQVCTLPNLVDHLHEFFMGGERLAGTGRVEKKAWSPIKRACPLRIRDVSTITPAHTPPVQRFEEFTTLGVYALADATTHAAAEVLLPIPVPLHHSKSLIPARYSLPPLVGAVASRRPGKNR